MLYVRRFLVLSLYCVLPPSEARGLLLLYRPRDVTTDCALSEHLRFDLSFGMGMSDTITLVFRTLSEIDYECGIDIATEKEFFLIIVIRFPNALGFNCERNPHAFTILKKDQCIDLCGAVMYKVTTPFFIVALRSRFRFRFLSNSSINADMQTHLYEVTATAARLLSTTSNRTCDFLNETMCQVDDESFCFTSGVVCDGIKNCGVSDAFDERTADCELPSQTLGQSPVIAVGAALCCALLAAVHITMKCLPPPAQSFFIFNINEDNRLCIEPVFRDPSGPLPEVERVKRETLLSVDYSSSSTPEDDENVQPQVASNSEENSPYSKRKSTMKKVTKKIQETIKLVATRNKITTGSEAVPKTSELSKNKSFIA